ncbi:MAG: hypothetical protein HYR55_11230, partial [Acidobacteria bacterium]|nr:hypothetical protein [Acidobacteriota bacterium]MBI3658228.1 hypothetical protein [Acidobacteriota bacterium]
AERTPIVQPKIAGARKAMVRAALGKRKNFFVIPPILEPHTLQRELLVAEAIRIESIVTVVANSAAIYLEWKRLVVLHSVLGKQGYDTRIVAAMNVHGIKNLLTFNTDDFKRFFGVTVINPQNVK